MLSLLRDSSGLSHEQFEFVDMAKASCEMLIRIVDDLLNFSKLEADKVTLEYIPLCFEEIIGGKKSRTRVKGYRFLSSMQALTLSYFF